MPYPTTKTTYTKSQLEKMLPYKTIADVYTGPLWNSPDRKPRYTATFTSKERDNIRRMISRAIKWQNEGLPETCAISDSGLRLWTRLGSFCESLKKNRKQGEQGKTAVFNLLRIGVFSNANMV